jgi:hypothetical protein
MDEMMEWASTLYHAIAIANGGSHILSLERKRAEAEEARQRARDEAIAARKRAEEEERRVKAEAEAKARAEEEARRQAEEAETMRRAALAEEERHRLEEADRKQREVDAATAELTAAMAAMDLDSLNSAISSVAACPVAGDVGALAEARALSASLAEKKAEEERAKVEAESNLRTALAAASISTVDQLSAAVDAGDKAHAEQDLVNEARNKLIAVRKERAAIEEVKSELSVAISFESMDSLVEALMSAATMNLQDPLVEEAQAVLNRLQAEEQRRVAEENARLAAEAAALDAELEVESAHMERLSEDMKDAAEEEILNLIGERATIANVGVDSDEEGRDQDDSEEESEDDEDEGASGGLMIDSNAVRAAVAASAAAKGVSSTNPASLPMPPAASRPSAAVASGASVSSAASSASSTSSAAGLGAVKLANLQAKTYVAKVNKLCVMIWLLANQFYFRP